MVKSKFAIATHIMTFLAKYPDEWVTSSHLASSINVNPVIVRNEVITLKEKLLLKSKEGKTGGVKLYKPAKDILLSEIFSCAKGSNHILGYSKNEPNSSCPIGSQINDNLTDLYCELDQTIVEHLEKTTLEEFKNRFE